MNKAIIITLALIVALSVIIVGCSSNGGNGYSNTAPTGNVVAPIEQQQPAAPVDTQTQVTVDNTSNTNITSTPDAYSNIQSANDDFNNIYTALNYT